jgi:hypothetical protein
MWRNNQYKIPPKPKTPEEKIDMMWDAIYNDIFHWMHWRDIKEKFSFTLLGIILAIVALLAGCVFKFLLG